jgi:probable rRNA maturation factor
MEENLQIINKTKGKLPSLPFAELKKEILGEGYTLSVAFVGAKKSRELNRNYRSKDRSTNILSFSLSKTAGELVLCPAVIKKETKKFGKNFHDLLGFLVIHGMLHLKGRRHGSIMEKEETKYDEKYFSGHRLGNRNHKSGRGRIFKRRKIS